MTIDTFLADLHKIVEPSMPKSEGYNSPNLLEMFRDGTCFPRVVVMQGAEGTQLHFDNDEDGVMLRQTMYGPNGKPKNKPLIFFGHN